MSAGAPPRGSPRPARSGSWSSIRASGIGVMQGGSRRVIHGFVSVQGGRQPLRSGGERLRLGGVAVHDVIARARLGTDTIPPRTVRESVHTSGRAAARRGGRDRSRGHDQGGRKSDDGNRSTLRALDVLWYGADAAGVPPQETLTAACSRALEACFPATDDAEIFARYATMPSMVEQLGGAALESQGDPLPRGT